jgi:hypothetical protein
MMIDKSLQDILLAAGLHQSDLGITCQDGICKSIVAREMDDLNLLLGTENSTWMIMSMHTGRIEKRGKEMDDGTLQIIQDWVSDKKKEQSCSTTTTKNSLNSSLESGDLPLRQIIDLTGSHQEINTLPSGLFFSTLLLLTSNGASKRSSNSTASDKRQTNTDSSVGRGSSTPATTQNTGTAGQVFFHQGGEVGTPSDPGLEVMATGVSIDSHLSAPVVDAMLDLVAVREPTGLERHASW